MRAFPCSVVLLCLLPIVVVTSLSSSLLEILGLLRFLVNFTLLVDVDKGRKTFLAFLAWVFEECLAGWRRVSHVLAGIVGGTVFLLASNQRIFGLHGVCGLADLRRVVVEAVVHVLHVHHVHVAATTFNQRQLFYVSRLVAIRVGRIAHIVATFRRHWTFLVVAHLQIRQLLLGFDWLLLSRVDVGDLAFFVG